MYNVRFTSPFFLLFVIISNILCLELWSITFTRTV